jgi:hypothetical protein
VPGERTVHAPARLLDIRPGVDFDAHPGRLVEAARLAEHAGRSEMRIELRTEAWGAVSIRAVVRENQLGAAIGVEGREAQSVLMAELPRLEQSLAARDVRLDRMEFYSGSPGGGSGDPGRGQEHPASRPSQAEISPARSFIPAERPITETRQPAYELGTYGRLSIVV